MLEHVADVDESQDLKGRWRMGSGHILVMGGIGGFCRVLLSGTNSKMKSLSGRNAGDRVC